MLKKEIKSFLPKEGSSKFSALPEELPGILFGTQSIPDEYLNTKY